MNTRLAVGFGAIAALAFVLHASPASAQVRITFGSPNNYSNPYDRPGYPTYSIPSNRVFNTVPSYRYQAVTPYRQLTPQYGVPTGRYSSGYRGTYVAPYQSYSPYQGTHIYRNPVYGTGYYQSYGDSRIYYGSPSQQRGAVIGGAIGGAIGGQRSSNLGAAIGAAVGGR